MCIHIIDEVRLSLSAFGAASCCEPGGLRCARLHMSGPYFLLRGGGGMFSISSEGLMRCVSDF